MRESVFFELRLRRSGAWRGAVWFVCGAAVATMAAWAAAMIDSQPASGRSLVAAVAAGLSLAAIALGHSLARIEGGALSSSEGAWTFVSDSGVRRSGAVEVAMDLGAFLLLRIVSGRGTSAWLPVQRRGVESQWHALRCAVYSPPLQGAGASTAPALPSE